MQILHAQLAAHGAAAQGGCAEAAGFFAHEEGGFQGVVADKAVLFEAGHDLNGGQDAEYAIEVAAAGDAVGVGAEHDGGQRVVFPRAAADDVPKGVCAKGQPRLFHPRHQAAASFPIAVGEGQTIDAGAIWFGGDPLHSGEMRG